MKILLDTNVVLEHLLDRKGFSPYASKIFTACEQGKVTGVLGATTVTTIHYLIGKVMGQKVATESIGLLLRLFEIAPINHLVLTGALQKTGHDFEDSVLREAAVHHGVHVIVTRDPKGFKGSSVPVLSPEEFCSSGLP